MTIAGSKGIHVLWHILPIFFLNYFQIVFSRNLKQPFGIAVFEDTLYWADQGHSSIMSVDKVTGRRLLPLTTDIDHVTSIVVDHPVLYQNDNQGNNTINT